MMRPKNNSDSAGILDDIIAMARCIPSYAANLKNFREEPETRDQLNMGNGQSFNAVKVQTLGACYQAGIQTFSWQL